MKRLLGLLATLTVTGVFAFVFTMSTPDAVGVPKGHVPLHKAQVCHKGDQVITVSEKALDAHLNHGDCQVPVCDFANIFHTGDDCSGLSGAGSHCGGLNPRDEASTPGCPAGRF